MKKLTKNEALVKIIYSANLFKNNLQNKNMIIICYSRKDNLYSHMEVAFLAKHFVHLTGIKIRPSKGALTFNPDIKSEDNFFNNCINHKVKISDFKLPHDGTVEMKMQVLPEMLNFVNSNRMMGSFSGNQIKLYTEKLVGNVRGCLGFVKDKRSNFFVPNTILKEDIRNITVESNGIVCIFERNIGDPKYNILRYSKSEKSKKKKDTKTGKIIHIPPINHIEKIINLDIVKDYVSIELFENYTNK